MRVAVNNHMYHMPNKEANVIKKIAKEQVKKGIYCIQKSDYIELRKDKFTSKQAMMKEIKKFNEKGFVCFWNWS